MDYAWCGLTSSIKIWLTFCSAVIATYGSTPPSLTLSLTHTHTHTQNYLYICACARLCVRTVIQVVHSALSPLHQCLSFVKSLSIVSIQFRHRLNALTAAKELVFMHTSWAASNVCSWRTAIIDMYVCMYVHVYVCVCVGQSQHYYFQAFDLL